MIHCYFIWNLPDIKSYVLKAYIKSYFGKCEIDIFGPGLYDRTHNRGCCRIILTDEQAKYYELFELTPFAMRQLDICEAQSWFVKRWCKNVHYAKVCRQDISIDVMPRNNFYCDEIKDEISEIGTECFYDSKLDIDLQEGFNISKDVEDVTDVCSIKEIEIDKMVYFLNFFIGALGKCPDAYVDFPAEKWKKVVLDKLQDVSNVDLTPLL